MISRIFGIVKGQDCRLVTNSNDLLSAKNDTKNFSNLYFKLLLNIFHKNSFFSVKIQFLVLRLNTLTQIWQRTFVYKVKQF